MRKFKKIVRLALTAFKKRGAPENFKPRLFHKTTHLLLPNLKKNRIPDFFGFIYVILKYYSIFLFFINNTQNKYKKRNDALILT